MKFILLLICPIMYGNNKCESRDYDHGGTVCVCNSTYCDTIDPIRRLPQGMYLQYTSNKAGLRFHKSIGNFRYLNFTRLTKYNSLKVDIKPDIKYQKIYGWGACFTDSTGINVGYLSEEAKNLFWRSYFGEDGIGYNFCRVPIGGTDFSTRPYTYDDTFKNRADMNLSNFNLTYEDYNYKIPYILEALNLTKNNLKFLASAWSPPMWMKTNGDISGIGVLKKEMYQPYANYYIKFLEAYEKEGINFWGLTTGNEPVNGLLPFDRINSVGWLPLDMKDWIAKYLGPTIKNSKYNNTKILALDDQRFFLPWWMDILYNSSAKSYIDGTAVHWYWDWIVSAHVLKNLHYKYPDKLIINTESSISIHFGIPVLLGNWIRGECYAYDIIQDLEHWVQGWLDWNFALDESGGPTYINNLLDAPIIINKTSGEFYKQPMYYMFGHFSKFIPVDSIRIGTNYMDDIEFKIVAFLRPDNGITIVILNQKEVDVRISLIDINRGVISEMIPKRSIVTIVYW